MRVELMLGDCLERMKEIPDQSVDMVMCDLPYGTTACAWDSVIPFAPLWEQYWRVTKAFAPFVMFGAEPFSSALRMSNAKQFKYDWIWEKSRSLGFTNAKNKPMNKHEVISVFCDGTVANRSERKMLYNPQNLVVSGKKVSGIKACKADSSAGGHRFGRASHKDEYVQEFTNYPTSVLKFDNEGSTVHPTQKPVALMDYMIRTYTNPGDVVLDNCMGSGTTGVAAVEAGRSFIGIERDEGYFAIAEQRIRGCDTYKMVFGEP